MHRRKFLLSSIGTGALAVVGNCIAAPAIDPIQAALKQMIGTREGCGAVAMVIDDNGTSTVSYGNSDASRKSLDTHTVFEIGSITKVMTALILTDMVAKGEVAMDDPVAKYLPASFALLDNGRPITLFDLANYHCGLPKTPGNLPPDWWANPNPFADYTIDKLSTSLSGYTPPYQPGTRFEYSSVGFALLGIALSQRAGKSFDALLIDRVCTPLGLAHTRVSLSVDMKKHLVQPHGINEQPTSLWDFGALQAAGAAHASVGDMGLFLKACMGLTHTRLDKSFERLLATRTPTTLAGTETGLGWFITKSGNEEIAWKTGLTGGCNSFIGFSTKTLRGAVVLSNFVWQPIDIGTTLVGMKMIAPDFDPGDLASLYA